MQHYLIAGEFPTVEGAWSSSPGFADYINSGSPGDKFDGFELKYRVCEPISGSGVAIAIATDIGKVWAHLGPWIKEYASILRSQLWYQIKNLLPCGQNFLPEHLSNE